MKLRTAKRVLSAGGVCAIAVICSSCVSETGEEVVTLEQQVWAISGSTLDPTHAAVENETTGIYGATVLLGGPGLTGGCSGSLVARDVVLTAAHCVSCNGTVSSPARTNVWVGADAGEANDNNDTSQLYVGDAWCSPWRLYDGDNFPDDMDGIGPYDIAVIELDNPVLLAHSADTLAVHLGTPLALGLDLHQGGQSAYTTKESTVIGFGRPCQWGHGCIVDGIRRKATTYSYVWDDPCDGDAAGTYCSDKLMIATNAEWGGTGVAPGDSGGPMVREFNGEQRVFGVASAQFSSQPFGFIGNVHAPVAADPYQGLWVQSFLGLPPDGTFADIAVFATQKATINDRVIVNGLGASVGSVAGVSVDVGSEAEVEAAFAVGSVHIRSHGHVETAKGWSHSNQHGGAADIYQYGPADIPSLDQFEQFMAGLSFTNSDWVNLDPGNVPYTHVLAPGQHGHYSVKRDVTLFLEEGTHYFASLNMDSDSQLNIDYISGGAVVVYIAGTLTLKGYLPNSTAVSDRLFLATRNQANVDLNTDFWGTIVAPNARIEMAAGKTLQGQLAAKNVTVHQEARVFLRPFLGSWYSP